jgi:hypothetical protein
VKVWLFLIVVFSMPTLWAEEAHDLYKSVDPVFLRPDHTDMQALLSERAMSPSQWVNSVNELDWDFMCVGETHSDIYRSLLSQHVFSDLHFDHFMLETTPPHLEALLNDYRQTGQAQMLGAPMGPVLYTVLSQNPDLKVTGVERTPAQSHLALQEVLELERGRLSREAFISQNIVDHYQAGEKTVALYGSLHCAGLNYGLGLDTPFFRLLERYFAPQNKKLINVRMIFAQNHRVLTALLRQYGLLQNGPVVLTNLGSIDPSEYNYHIDLFVLFMAYDNLIVVP